MTRARPLTVTLLATSLTMTTAVAQQPPEVRSPAVGSDGRVTFSIYAPKAAAVTLRSGELDRVASTAKELTKAENGVWTLTLGPLPPGIYDYAFDVDGVVIADPSSPTVFGNLRGSRGFVEVPGPPGRPRPDEWRDVPHGAVTAHWYQSGATSSRRRVHVYTPPGYAASERRYPVLYLLHGLGDNDSHWVALGRANVITDNLLADKKAEPMVIVMPDGLTEPPPQSGDAPDAFFIRNLERFERDLLQHVVPLVERSYRVETDRARRAITGLSMGGGQSLYVGLRHPHRFAWIGAFSSAPRGLDPVIAQVKQDARAMNDQVRLLWLRIGKDDFLLDRHRAFIERLRAAGVRHDYAETAGAHMWSVWRGYLAEFLPLIFRTTGG